MTAFKVVNDGGTCVSLAAGLIRAVIQVKDKKDQQSLLPQYKGLG